MQPLQDQNQRLFKKGNPQTGKLIQLTLLVQSSGTQVQYVTPNEVVPAKQNYGRESPSSVPEGEDVKKETEFPKPNKSSNILDLFVKDQNNFESKLYLINIL